MEAHLLLLAVRHKKEGPFTTNSSILAERALCWKLEAECKSVVSAAEIWLRNDEWRGVNY